MLLPRPARLLKQSCRGLNYHRAAKPFQVGSTGRRTAATAKIVPGHIPREPPLDPSYAPFLHDINVRKPTYKGTNTPLPPPTEAEIFEDEFEQDGFGLVIDPIPVAGLGKGKGGKDLMAQDEYENDPARDAQKSPAAVMGSKRVGTIVLPDQLLEAVQAVVDGEYSSSDTIEP
jgi:hypothetical protein